jgi:hypothetical protein
MNCLSDVKKLFICGVFSSKVVYQPINLFQCSTGKEAGGQGERGEGVEAP